MLAENLLPQTELSRKRILLVDDDDAMRVLLPKALVRKGFDVGVAGDADTAERLLEQGCFDAVIVDVQMPGRDGLSLALAIQTRWPAVMIIFVSAYDTDSTRKRAAALGAQAFLAKPVGVDELVWHLRRK